MVLAAMIIPFIMIAVQIVLVDYGTEIEILNKPLVSGRDKMYVSLLELFRSSHTTFAFGRYCEFKLDNLHNSPLTLLASFGFVGLIIYFIFWLFYLNDVRKQSFDPISRTACIALLCCMIHSSSETAFTVGYVPFCVFVLVLSMIAKGDIAIKNSPKEDNTLWQL